MDNSEGYFILYRKIFSDPLWLNGTPAQKLLMVLCIGKANHEDRQWQWLGEKFEVKRGQFVTSIERLKMEIGRASCRERV